MPEQPARDRFRRLVEQKDALPRQKHLVEPHLAVELVIAAAEWCRERVRLAGRDFAANHRDPRCGDRHDEGGTLAVDVDGRKRADIDILGIGRARMHADLAAEYEARIGFADDPECGALAGVFAHAVADRRGTGRKGQKTPGVGDQLAIGGGIADLFWREIGLLGGAQNAKRDQLAIGRRMRQVAGAEKGSLGKALPHSSEVFGGLRSNITPRQPVATRVRRRQDDVPPLGIKVEIVPGGIFVDDRAGGGVRGDVLDQAFTQHPDFASVMQGLAVVGTGPHRPSGDCAAVENAGAAHSGKQQKQLQNVSGTRYNPTTRPRRCRHVCGNRNG